MENSKNNRWTQEDREWLVTAYKSYREGTVTKEQIESKFPKYDFRYLQAVAWRFSNAPKHLKRQYRQTAASTNGFATTNRALNGVINRLVSMGLPEERIRFAITGGTARMTPKQVSKIETFANKQGAAKFTVTLKKDSFNLELV